VSVPDALSLAQHLSRVTLSTWSRRLRAHTCVHVHSASLRGVNDTYAIRRPCYAHPAVLPVEGQARVSQAGVAQRRLHGAVGDEVVRVVHVLVGRQVQPARGCHGWGSATRQTASVVPLLVLHREQVMCRRHGHASAAVSAPQIPAVSQDAAGRYVRCGDWHKHHELDACCEDSNAKLTCPTSAWINESGPEKGAHRTAASCFFCLLLSFLDLGFSPVSWMNLAQAASVGLQTASQRRQLRRRFGTTVRRQVPLNGCHTF